MKKRPILFKGSINSSHADQAHRSRDHSELILGLLLLGTIVDYGGGLYIKPIVFVMAVLYLLAHKRAWGIWRQCLPSLLVVIFIPLAITLVHLLFSPALTLGFLARGIFQCLGSPVYYVGLPLIYMVGVKRTAEWLVVILSVLALVTMLLMVAYTMGLIDFFQYTDFMVSHRVALFGTDTRSAGLGGGEIGIPGFGAAQAFPIGFTLALALNPILALVIALAIFVGTQRGQILGLLLAGGIILIMLRNRLRSTILKFIRKPRNILFLSIIGALVLVILIKFVIYFNQPLALLTLKYQLLLSGQDESTLVRHAHLVGYWQRIADFPLGLIWGFGPRAWIYNSLLGEKVFMTEMVILTYALWYGLPYTFLFYSWIVYEIWALAKCSSSFFDLSLTAACIVLLVIGNINPVMQTPLAFILLAMLRARRLELSVQ